MQSKDCVDVAKEKSTAGSVTKRMCVFAILLWTGGESTC